MTAVRERLWAAATSRARLFGVLATIVAMAAACAEKAPQDTFEPEGPQADKIDNLAVPVFIAAGVVGVILFVGIAFVLIRFRQRKNDDRPDPVQFEGKTNVEIGWTIGPFLILLPFAILTVSTGLSLANEPDDTMHIKVFGHQWWWSYEYDLDGDGTSEIITANDLVIPIDTDIVLDMTSRDVIHSFWIPKLTGTRDVVPGRTHHLVIKADTPGVYEGQCKEFCGLSHANMRARAVALTQPDFTTWLDQQQQPATLPEESDSVAYAGMQVFVGKCASCHQVNGLVDADGEPIEVEGSAPLVADHAPNLTHLMSRGVFASAEFPLYVRNPTSGRLELNRPDLEAWLRDPPGVLPMAPDEQRGMPNLGLTDDEIDQLVAFLQFLGPPPPAGAEGAQ